MVQHPGGFVLAVVDGLGHGVEAAFAAQAVVAIVEAHPMDSLPELMQRCHEGLLRTRGASIGLASFNSLRKSLTWIGVGNIEGALLRARECAGYRDEHLLERSGVAGYILPALVPQELPVNKDDVLIMMTDGIHESALSARTPLFRESPQRAANYILQKYARANDDALVLVARFS